MLYNYINSLVRIYQEKISLEIAAKISSACMHVNYLRQTVKYYIKIEHAFNLTMRTIYYNVMICLVNIEALHENAIYFITAIGIYLT